MERERCRDSEEGLHRRLAGDLRRCECGGITGWRGRDGEELIESCGAPCRGRRRCWCSRSAAEFGCRATLHIKFEDGLEVPIRMRFVVVLFPT